MAELASLAGPLAPQPPDDPRNQGEPPDNRSDALIAGSGGGGPRSGWRWWIRRPGLILGIGIIALVIAWAVAPGLFTHYDPTVGVPKDKLQPPSAAHLFGTDQLGRDLYTRVVYGASLSLKATLLAVAIALVVGTAVGLVAGFLGGVVDEICMRVVDVLLALPGLLLSLAIITALGFGTIKVAVAVGIASIAGFARLMRSEVLRIQTASYVEAAHAAGVRRIGVITRHVLPNSSGPVLVLAALEFGAVILSVSALSFLGFGAAKPAPEWGSLVAEGRNYLATSWWLTTLPGLVVVAVVLAANRASRAIDERRTR